MIIRLNRRIKLKCISCGKDFEVKQSKSKNGRAKYCSFICRMDGLNKNQKRENHTRWKGGLPKCINCNNLLKTNIKSVKRCWECHLIYNRGSNHYSWKGGKTSENIRIRNSIKYKNWRQLVFERDGYICQLCHQVGGKLNIHHIRKFSKYPELRFDLNNGICLCKNCHFTKVNGYEILYEELFYNIIKKKIENII